MPLPKFIGIGAPRCGTQWLAECLAEHPEISLPPKGVYLFTTQDALLVDRQPLPESQMRPDPAIAPRTDGRLSAAESTPAPARCVGRPLVGGGGSGHPSSSFFWALKSVRRPASRAGRSHVAAGFPAPSAGRPQALWGRSQEIGRAMGNTKLG